MNQQELRAEMRALGAELKKKFGTARVCVNGHLQPEVEDSNSSVCSKCRAPISEECTCGYPLLPGRLTNDYRPRYREKALELRDICPACQDLYPWVRSWLLRPIVDQPLTRYECDLADHYIKAHVDSFVFVKTPSAENYGLTTKDMTGRTPHNWLTRVFGGGVRIQNPKHPRHQDWSGYQAAVCAAENERQAVIRNAAGVIQFLRKAAYEAKANELKKLSRWRELTGQEFERELADLLRRRKYVVTHTGGPGDQGADIILSTDKGRIVVQCKAYSGKVGPQPVRDLCGSMVHHRAHEGWLVTIDGFSESAYKFAHNKPIKLLLISSFLRKSGEPDDL